MDETVYDLIENEIEHWSKHHGILITGDQLRDLMSGIVDILFVSPDEEDDEEDDDE